MKGAQCGLRSPISYTKTAKHPCTTAAFLLMGKGRPFIQHPSFKEQLAEASPPPLTEE